MGPLIPYEAEAWHCLMDLGTRLSQCKAHIDSSQLTTCLMDGHRVTQELQEKNMLGIMHLDVEHVYRQHE